MSQVRSATLLCCVWLALGSSAWAQKSLYGSVRGSDHTGTVPLSFPVKLTPILVSDDHALPSRTSLGQAFWISVPSNAVLNLVFQSDGYEDFTVARINTGMADDGYRVPPVPITLSRIYGQSLTRAEVGRRLRRARAIAKITGAISIFLYNLETYRNAYGTSLDVLQEIEQFKIETKANEQFRDLLSPKRELEMTIYGGIIDRLQNQPLSSLDPAQVLKLMQDDSVFPGIRAKAMQAFTRLERAPEVNEQALSFLRLQSNDVKGELFAAARGALAGIGTEADVRTIIADVKSSDFERAATALAAVGEAGLTQAAPAIAELLNTDVDPAIKIEAVNSLSALAYYQRDRVAIEALTSALARDSNPTVRVEAAEGLAGVMRTDAVKRTLEDAATKDDSPDVRTAAAGAKNVKLNKAGKSERLGSVQTVRRP